MCYIRPVYNLVTVIFNRTIHIISYNTPYVNKKRLKFTAIYADTIYMDFYDRVKELAKSKGFLLTEFLQSLGINYDSYKSAKRLGYLPRADEALNIAKKLGTSVEYLVTGEHITSDKELRELKKQILNFAQSIQ